MLSAVPWMPNHGDTPIETAVENGTQAEVTAYVARDLPTSGDARVARDLVTVINPDSMRPFEQVNGASSMQVNGALSLSPARIEIDGQIAQPLGLNSNNGVLNNWSACEGKVFLQDRAIGALGLNDSLGTMQLNDSSDTQAAGMREAWLHLQAGAGLVTDSSDFRSDHQGFTAGDGSNEAGGFTAGDGTTGEEFVWTEDLPYDITAGYRSGTHPVGCVTAGDGTTGKGFVWTEDLPYDITVGLAQELALINKDQYSGAGLTMVTLDSFNQRVGMEVQKADMFAQSLGAGFTDATYTPVNDPIIAGEWTTELLQSQPLTVTPAELVELMETWEETLVTVGEDEQLANVELQNMLQKQQQTLQMSSNISNQLHGTALSVIRKIG